MAVFSFDDELSASPKAGTNFEPGVYKFKVKSAESLIAKKSGNEWFSIKLETWSEDGKKGPQVKVKLFPKSDAPNCKQEIQAFGRICVGPDAKEINMPQDFAGKSGLVVVRNGEDGYLEPEKHSYFYPDRTDWKGNPDTILESLDIAVNSVKHERAARTNNYQAAQVETGTPETDIDVPF